ncbi:STY0301 family protein [Oxalobacteraceae bacterium A2-2]
MDRKIMLTMGWLLAMAGPHANGKPQSIECPAAIKADSILVAGAPQPWRPFVAAPLYLHAAAPIYGPPEQRGDIADFITRPGKAEWSYTYRLEGQFEDGKWMQCAYGANNEITLSQPIPNDTEECTITYRKGSKVAQHLIRIRCK